MANKALVIDDDKVTLELLTFQLESEGFEVTTAESGEVGLEQIKQNDFDVILTDLHLPDVSGIGLVKSSKELAPQTEIIMITGDGSNDRAIEATKAGAFWYLEKPLDFDELFELIGKAVERKRQAAEIKELRGRLSSRTSYEGVIGGARSMQNIYEIIENVADSEANILILGESGTGKEVIANAVHYKSRRSNKPFVKVNCSALRRTSSSLSCSVTSKDRSRGRTVTRSDLSVRRMEAVCFLMRSEKCPLICSRNFCASCRRKSIIASAATSRRKRISV
jgi:DNA-binding NtrC family response regulator